jgi:hypothetical protein
VGREDFRGTHCYRVDLEIAPDVVRRVYFDVESGLLAGRTSSEEATVVFGDWRRVEGLLLPFQRTVFEQDSGQEQRWRFDQATFEALDADAFALPEDLEEPPEDSDAEPTDGSDS